MELRNDKGNKGKLEGHKGNADGGTPDLDTLLLEMENKTRQKRDEDEER